MAPAVRDGARFALRARRLVRPLELHGFRMLALGRLVSQVGDWLTLTAVVGWLYAQTGSTGNVALVLLCRLAPSVLGGGAAALLVDRLAKTRLLVAVEVARAVAAAGALAAILSGQVWLVLVALAASGALAAVNSAAVPALVPSVVPASRLPAANACLGVAKDASIAGGALLGGVVLATVGITAALVADLITFAVAAAVFSRLPPVAAGAQADRGRRGALDGIRHLAERRILLLLVVAFGVATLATGLTNTTLPRFLDAGVGLGPSAYGFGLAALAGGLVLGQMAVGAASVPAGAARWIGAALAVMAVLFVALALAGSVVVALAVLAAIGFVDGITDVLFETLVQREADPAHYGAIFGAAGAFMTTTMAVAFALAPVLNGVVDARLVIAGAGGVLLLVGGGTFAALSRGAATEARVARASA